MSSKLKSLMLTLIALLVSHILVGSNRAVATPAPNCRDVFSRPAPARPFDGPSGDLLAFRAKEIRNLTKTEVRSLNIDDVQAFEGFKPAIEQSDRIGGKITYSQLQRVLQVIETHPVAGAENRAKYQREEAEIGYCFARATLAHLLLKKMGLAEASMRKVWLVGPQKNPGGKANWGYHVAMAVFVDGYGWTVLDTHTFRVQPVRLWYNHFAENSLDGKARFYVTTAKRFGINLEEYSRFQMGLDVDVETDWYRHYFVDSLAWLRETKIESLGLQRVTPASETTPAVLAPEKSGLSRWLGSLF